MSSSGRPNLKACMNLLNKTSNSELLMHALLMVMNIWEMVPDWSLLHSLIEFMLLPHRLSILKWDVLLLDQLVPVKLNLQKILPTPLQRHAMCSTVLIRWTIKVWQVFSKVLLLPVLGVASMSSTDWFLKYFLCAQYSSNQLLMQSDKELPVSLFKAMRFLSTQLVVLSLQ